MTMLILTTTLCEWGNKEIEAMKLHSQSHCIKPNTSMDRKWLVKLEA